ncbi:uncharacterized protein LOC111378065 [Olea europaea var. sylvestris]|uniref:uncharacterized protein LOC111378065 n=1 Tax=Olea europaea var. sylvestris TaxID=158386 RepID=UPI000C1CF081|nr:uncharacterized protein LOC111378065 [Olea europaea var. sylvestris]
MKNPYFLFQLKIEIKPSSFSHLQWAASIEGIRMDDNTQFLERQSIGFTPSSRAKSDPAWEDFLSSRDIDGKVCYVFIATIALKVRGINRMKYHLFVPRTTPGY